MPDSPFPLSSAPVSAKLVAGSPQGVIRNRPEVTGSHGAASVCRAASLSLWVRGETVKLSGMREINLNN